MEKWLGSESLLDEWVDDRMKTNNKFWESRFTKSNIRSEKVTVPEMLFGYFIGPFGALLSSGIFTSILQNYFTDVLKLDLTFLTTLQLVSTIFIIAANLIVRKISPDDAIF